MVSSEHYPIDEQLKDDEIDIADLLMVLWRYRRLIVGLSVFFLLMAAGMSLTKKRTYTAQTSIINMVDNRMLNNVQGFDFGTMAQSPRNSILSAILNSQSLAESVVESQNLLPDLFPDLWDKEKQAWIEGEGEKTPTKKDGAMVLQRMIKVSPNESSNTIAISVTTNNPELSAHIANAYTRELDEYLKNNSFSSVQKSREFLEKQLDESKETLERLKRELETFQKENGIFDLSKQIEASIEAYHNNALLLDKYSTEAEMTESISSALNPKVINLKKYIETLQARMDQLKTGEVTGKGEVQGGETHFTNENQYLLPLNRITELKLRIEKIHRDISNQQKINDLFVESYEKITIQEAKDKIFVTVLDEAEPPMKSNSRKTLFKMILGCFAGAMMGVFAAFIMEFYQNHLKQRFYPKIEDPDLEPEDQTDATTKTEHVRVVYRRENGIKNHMPE